MMNSDDPLAQFEREVCAAFGSTLKRYNFVETERHYSAEAFGNAYISYASEAMRLRVVRDRGEFSAQVAPPGLEVSSAYMDLRNLLNYLVPNSVKEDSLNALATALAQHYASVKEFLQPFDYASRLRSLDDYYGERFSRGEF